MVGSDDPSSVRLAFYVARQPAHRFQTAEEVVRAIDARRVTGLRRKLRARLGWGLAAVLVLLAWCWQPRGCCSCPGWKSQLSKTTLSVNNLLEKVC